MTTEEIKLAERAINHIFKMTDSHDVDKLYNDYLKCSKSSRRLPQMTRGEFYDFVVDQMDCFHRVLPT